MKISAQEEYGLRCVLQLVQASEGGLPVKEIARLEGITPAYAEKLLRLLSKADIIHSIRGTKGGYRLNRKPEEISLGAVVRALGSVPSTAEICGRFTGNRTSCVHIDNCCIRAAWETLTTAIQNFLDQTYLSDLVGTEAHTKETLNQRVQFVRTSFPTRQRSE